MNVRAEKEQKYRVGLWEQVITVSVTLGAALVAVMTGAPDKWLTAIFITVVSFGGMISFYRTRWPFRRFWEIMAVALAVHLVLIWLVFGMLLRQRADVSPVVCLPAIVLECFIIYHVVRFLENKMSPSPPNRGPHLKE